MPPANPFSDGTYGIFLADNDFASWAACLLFSFEVLNPPADATLTQSALPLELANPISIVLLPV